jgi:hypothetical protein
MIRTALYINERIGNLEGIAKSSRSLGGIAIERRQWDKARHALTTALAAFTTLGRASTALDMRSQIDQVQKWEQRESLGGKSGA